MKALWQVLGVLAVLCSFSACGKSGASDASGGSQQVGSGQAAISSSGGTIKITDPTSPIAGLTLEVPPSAIAQGNVNIVITYEDALPGSLSPSAIGAGTVVLSKIIVLTKNEAGSFDLPVRVRVPYDASKLDKNDVPSVFCWNETRQSYDAVAVVEFDSTAGFVTFETAHFSKYVVMGIKGLANKITSSAFSLSLDTGFRPSGDGFFRPNFGSYSSSGGNCLGMSSFSDWFFENRVSPQSPLYSSYLEGNLSSTDDDLTSEELIVRAHAAASQIWARRLYAQFSKLTQVQTGLSLIQNLQITQKPQVFLMWGNPTWWQQYMQNQQSWGHALVVYRYSLIDSTFYMYDPNLRGDDTMGIRFDANVGFTSLTKTGMYSPEPDNFAYDSVGSIYSPGDMEALYNGANTGWNEGQYGKINITNLQFDSVGRVATVAARDNVLLEGSVTSNGGKPGMEPNYIRVFMDGKFIGDFPLNGNSFNISLPQIPDQTLTDMAVVAFRWGPVGNRVTSLYGTFRRFQIKFGSALENIGFEKGDFSLWNSVRFLWGGGDRVAPSDKSTIVGVAYDPIATSIVQVLHGKWAARVNNNDPNYHISQVSRDVVIPADTTAFSLSFNWAAVLEDPQHQPQEQPYVDIKVENVILGTTLYSRRYFANDPTFSGWKSFQGGQWKAIDWQSVTVGKLEQYKGHTIRVTVEAADCALGGHGGYAYLDAAE